MSAYQKSSFLPYLNLFNAIPQRQRLNFATRSAGNHLGANTRTVRNFRDVWKKHSEGGKSGCADNMEEEEPRFTSVKKRNVERFNKKQTDKHSAVCLTSSAFTMKPERRVRAWGRSRERIPGPHKNNDMGFAGTEPW